MLKLLAQEAGFTDLKAQLNQIQGAVLPEAMNEEKNKRENRKLQYEISTKQAKKWVSQIHRNRDADQLDLGQVEDVMPKSVAAVVQGFSAKSDFEKDIAEAVEAAGLTEERLKGADGNDGLLLPGQSKEIVDAGRQEQIARLKNLMFREYVRSKRLNRIKSKTWRKLHSKSERAEQAKLLERMRRENPKLAAEMQEQLERKFAEARTQRQRTARVRWAKVMQRFGGEDARKAVATQAQRDGDRQKDLERAVKG